jgi:putative spermidine/putrescine transport system ATP-binding protein
MRQLTKRYGGFTAADRVDIAAEAGEFLTLLGPSGSGKTTVLMMIAGFVQPSEGQVLLNGQDITALPPEQRHFGMVFQGYALFPHMTVAENIAFPLRVRRMGRAEQQDKVRAVLDLVQLTPFAERRPAQISGGQQQRVALARALVFDPAVLLLDEPLSALDKKLRAELQDELKILHRRVGRTFVNVTHDQEEALSLSDRIAILNHGRVVQQGQPEALYENPGTRFVAGFLGKSNFFEGRVETAAEGRLMVRKGATRLSIALPAAAAPLPQGGAILLSLRPEKIAVLEDGASAENTVEGTITAWSYLGAGFALAVETADLGLLHLQLSSWGIPFRPEEGRKIRLGWAAGAMVPLQEDLPAAA